MLIFGRILIFVGGFVYVISIVKEFLKYYSM